MFTTKEKIQAVLDWAITTNNPYIDQNLIYAIVDAFKRNGQLNFGQQEQLDLIIEKYGINIAEYLN